MPLSDGIPSTPPVPGASLEESLKYYKAQYEVLESELADFQNSSKELEAELEKDIEASEKREQKLKDKATNLQYEVDEWKTKHKQAKSEAASAQNALQKEITELRDTNRTLQLRLRDIEVANDDFERKQRNTESSLEDIESKYNQTIERSVMLEEEMKAAEQEREALRIEAQRLKDELSDLKIETDIVNDKLRKADKSLGRRSNTFSILPATSASPRSELSPTTTDASFDTPPAKTSSSGVSDTPTPPSPPISERSGPTKPSFATPSMSKSRTSLSGNIPTPRQSTYGSRPATTTQAHARGPSVPAVSRTGPTSTYRQSLTNNHTRSAPVRGNIPQSQSILHLRNLRSKMQSLETRVHNARSKLPAPASTPPRASPRPGSAKGNHASATPTPLSTATTITSSVTVRSRKRTTGSTISGASTLPEPNLDSTDAATPSAVPRSKPSRQSLTSQYQYTHAPRPPPSPTRPRSQAGPLSTPNDMPAPPPRPESRASRTSNIYSHSRPGSRASLSGFPRPASSYGTYAPNASTNTVRPKSSLSNHGYDGTFDDDESIMEGDESIMEDMESSFIRPTSSAGAGASQLEGKDFATPTARRTTFSKRTSDVGTAIPTPKSHLKRESISHASVSSTNRFAGPALGSARRQSQQGFVFADAPTPTSATSYTTATPKNVNVRPASVLGRRQSQQSFSGLISSTGGAGGNDGMMRPPSRAMSPRKRGSMSQARIEVDETF